MPNYCSAFGCSNSSTKESCRKKSISFHKFPLTDKLLLRRWIVNIRRANFQPTHYSYVCSEHFTDDNFYYQPFTNRRGLIKGAVPTKFSFNADELVRRRKKGMSGKNQSFDVPKEDSASNSTYIARKRNLNKIEADDPALLEIYMNEKFYSPEQLEAATGNLPKSSKSKQKTKQDVHLRTVALKEKLHAKILLRSLKKQLLDAEIKAANAKRDYYEAKKEMFQIQDSSDSEDSSDSDPNLPINNIRTRLDEEKLAAQIEEKMLQEQLEEAQMQAACYEKEYYEAKSSMLISS